MCDREPRSEPDEKPPIDYSATEAIYLDEDGEPAVEAETLSKSGSSAREDGDSE